MKTTIETFHDDLEEATGRESTVDLSPLTIGSKRYKYLQDEVSRYYGRDAAPIQYELTREQRIKANDLMTMANVANESEPIYGSAMQLNTSVIPHTVAPMAKPKKKRGQWLDHFLNGVLGVMLGTLLICVLVLMFAWV